MRAPHLCSPGQGLALAVGVLMLKPRLAILDEPTAGTLYLVFGEWHEGLILSASCR